jgi:broad specificity phosphatase PhoE
MARPPVLVLVRHAESQRNVAKKGNVFFADDESRRSVRGVADHRIAITDAGWRQAELTGQRVRERFGTFDVVFHSGYRRTEETAEGILRAYTPEERRAMPQLQDVFIRERDTGFAYDMTTAEAEASFPFMDEYWRTSGPFFARPPGGESVAQVCERVHLFLRRLAHDHSRQRVLVVTHGVTLRAFRFLLEGWDYETAEEHMRLHTPQNCSVTVYEPAATQSGYALAEYNTVYWRES